MSSREIAHLCDKRHSNVKRDCEIMFSELEIDALSFEHIYFDGMNRQQTEYLLNEELTMTLVTGYNVILRNRVIKRWQELEAPKELSKIQILQLAIESERHKLELEEKLLSQAPKVQYFDRVAESTNLLNASEIAKKFGFSAQKLNKQLENLGVYDRRIAGRIFAQWFIDDGFGEVKQTDKGYPQSKFTNLGEQWIFRKLITEGVAA